MPPQTKSIEDIYKQFELDMLYAGKSSGDSEGIIRAMQGQRELASMPQSGAIESLTPIGPIDLAAETAMTGASQMEGMNPLAMFLAGALAPGAYKNIKTTNTPALLKKFNVKVDNPLYHNTDIANANKILQSGKLKPGYEDISITRNPMIDEVYGKGTKGVQIVLDKTDIPSMRYAQTTPYVHHSGKGSIFGKSTPWFEAEERITFSKPSVYKKGNVTAETIEKAWMEKKKRRDEFGLPLKNIKALKLRKGFTSEHDYQDNRTIKNFIKKASDKKIPLIIEPDAEIEFMGLLDIMNTKQQSKILKNAKFAGRRM